MREEKSQHRSSSRLHSPPQSSINQQWSMDRSFLRTSNPAMTALCCDVLPASNQASFLPFALLTRTKSSNISFTLIWLLSFWTQLASQQHNMLQRASSPSQAWLVVWLGFVFFFFRHWYQLSCILSYLLERICILNQLKSNSLTVPAS